ncbi:MAG: adenylosuccinate synthase, partial [Bacteroidota bacterium]|nr:adenylosuccinate synthase [Bacteroidota bacterium]
MPVDVILGLQWGDEGKGKIVDLLSEQYSVIIRFQGGPNAGHTIWIGDKKFVLHQVPSGIIRPDIINVIGDGVVLDPIILKKEISNLEKEQIDVQSRLHISLGAHLIMPTHRLLDALNEKADDGTRVGSTLKGIGPTYQDKVGRFGLRIGDILRHDFEAVYAQKRQKHLRLLEAMGYNEVPDDTEWLSAIEELRRFSILDTSMFLQDRLVNGEAMLAEGAQGTLLDVNFGSYPYVTSSHTVAASACIGSGFSHKYLRKIYGVFKAYTTRVGEGPYPTELHGVVGEHLRTKGKEFGSTTGRPRRCGWLDMPALRYAIALNGVDELIMMKMDVLSELDKIPVCTHYKDESGEEAHFSSLSFGESVTTEYDALRGWQEE